MRKRPFIANKTSYLDTRRFKVFAAVGLLTEVTVMIPLERVNIIVQEEEVDKDAGLEKRYLDDIL